MLELKMEQTEIDPKEEPYQVDKSPVLKFIYKKLWESKIDVNEGNLKAVSQYKTNYPKTFYAAWVKPNLPYDVVPENIRILTGSDYDFLITTDRIAMEDFLLEKVNGVNLEEVYGVKNPLD